MKHCPACGNRNPDSARYCMTCGKHLEHGKATPVASSPTGSWFFLSLGASLLLSLILIGVFKLPVFILGAFLPLFWLRKDRGKSD